MRLRTFTAATMREAMSQVRDTLGADAVILSTHESERGRGVRVTAGIDDSRADLLPTPPPAAPSPLAEALAALFGYHGVPEELAGRLLRTAERLAGSGWPEATTALAQALGRRIGFEPLGLDAARPLVLVGPSGAGKTTTAAKLAARSALAGEPAQLMTTDTLRAAAVSQLEAFAGVLEQPIASAATPKLFRRLLAERAGGPPVVVDTPGTNPFEARELEDLSGFLAAGPLMPVLVLAAGTDALEAAETARVFARLGCRHLVVTRLDAARRLGALVSAADAGDLALGEAGVSASIPHGLKRLEADTLAMLLGADPLDPARLGLLEDSAP